MKKTAIMLALAVTGFALGSTSCLSDGEDTIIVENGNPTDIPSDSQADPNPSVTTNNATIPNIQYATVDEDGVSVLRIDMTGIQDQSTLEWLRLLGTGEKGQNVWVEVDGKPKGVKVYNTADDENATSVPVDLVFLVDNSGSMSDEANAIARDITSWAQKLEASGLDIHFGCVGYGGNVGANNYSYLEAAYGVTGALNLTSYDVISEYLNERGETGTSRTKGFYGHDGTKLAQIASNSEYSKAGGECGVQALRFADENFTFTDNSNRIYINFTDDANYHGGSEALSTDYIEDDWNSLQGTIHTVFSGSRASAESQSHGDAPWLMSEYTGGTVINTNSSFTGVTLESLPVSDAMMNSYIIRFTNIEEFMDGQPHEVRITVYNGSVQAERVFYVVFGER